MDTLTRLLPPPVMNNIGFGIKRVPGWILLFVILTFDVGSAQFLVEVLEQTPFSNHRPVVRCDATGANFGEDVMAFSFGLNAIGCAIRTVPVHACSDVVMPKFNKTGCDRNFAVVPRGNCTFSEKAYYVQQASYEALIMYNDPGKTPMAMSGSKYADQIQIPVVMVNYACMESLMGHYSAENGYTVTLKASPGYYDLIKYLVPFVAIVGFCFVVLFISLVIRLCRERRRLARKRLSRSNLKKIPTKKFKKGDPEETCAICLEDFVEGDKLRVLPCRHAYHTKCVDPWLTKNRKVCPVCKRKVGPSSSDSSDSDSERASTSTSVSAPQITREQDPLLRNAQPMATSSSRDFPYPAPAQGQSPSSAVPLTNNGSFSRAASLLNLSNLFHVGRASTASRMMRPQSNSPVANPSTSSREHLIGGASPRNHSAEEANSSLNIGDVHSTDAEVLNGRVPWARGLKSRFSKFVQSLSGQPHTLLNDEEDASTTVTRDELESDPVRRQCSSEWANDNTGYDGQSSPVDGNSLTTVYSNVNITGNNVAVEMEPTELNQEQKSGAITQPRFEQPPITPQQNGHVPNNIVNTSRLNVVVFEENSPVAKSTLSSGEQQ